MILMKALALAAVCAVYLGFFTALDHAVGPYHPVPFEVIAPEEPQLVKEPDEEEYPEG